MQNTSAQQQQVPIGAYFGLPGMTQPMEQFDNVTQVVTPLTLTALTPFNPPNALQKTDIVRWWELETSISIGTTFTGSTISPEAPYNLFQALKVKYQGQYSPLEVESGFDAAFFQMVRPMRGGGQNGLQNLMETNIASTYSNATIPQTNQNTTGIAANPTAGSVWNFTLELPASVFLDQYWNLAADGTILPGPGGVARPVAAIVSPQYMGGGERNVTPAFNFAALTAANADQGPLVGSTAGAATVTQSIRRVGYYGTTDPSILPPVYNWQYRRASRRVPFGAATKIDIPVPEYGQLLCVAVRIFDPTAGTYYNIANITKCQLLYGSNLARFDDDIIAMQRRFIDQHGFVPPQGMVAWDMAASTSGTGLSNDSRVLNTLTNANTHVHIENTTAPAATAYAVILTELLVPVTTQ
jgi:hypothetical protein